jgi:hypothetical protein
MDIDQLILPEFKRIQVVKLADDDIVSGHVACSKSTSRPTHRIIKIVCFIACLLISLSQRFIFLRM